ncbi:MAG: acetyl-CoA carboxylase biotin carboxylase subunit [Calditrichota bacterium]
MALNTVFSKILIANRGEIAVRVIRACHELGIKAVAVYSEADKTAMHVREADEAYLIGPAPAVESYLRQDVLVETAIQAGCCAVHPGYGFLAENADFAELCGKPGLVFIGSSPPSIRLLGDKMASRQTMRRAGVPVIPGCDKPGLSDADLAREADGIGYPVLVKAAAGGGGKGMRVVHAPADLQKSLEAARREAKAAFGNATVFLESFLIEPRHVEFQIFGDAFGHRIHLCERECSIQRRHQKIIEETPSPALDPDLRARMGETAVQVAAAANYYNAGTVEFLLDRNRNFYFLEVNTRIQVEHPITEEVIGVDLVVEQIRVAMGQELSWSQADIKQRGHAVECRLYAEDAANGFLPSAGPVLFLQEPIGPGLRFDSGVQTGDEVSVYYDPIIAKLVAYGQTREAAIQRSINALEQTAVLGLTTNREFLIAVLKHPAFQAGDLHIGFLQQHLPNWQPDPPEDDELALILALAGLAGKFKSPSNGNDQSGEPRLPNPWQSVGAWQICAGGQQS